MIHTYENFRFITSDMRKPMYFWTGTEVLQVHDQILTNTCKPYEGMPCVDTNIPDGEGRCGLFMNIRARSSRKGPYYVWHHKKPEDFPKEFRTWLLILGVHT